MALEAARVRGWLRESKQISVPDDWLEACVEWVLSENERSKLSNNELCDEVYDQWLVADLREIGASCLPAEAATDAKYFLTGFYGLQVNSVADVSHSFYSQLQKVTGTENSNALVSAAESTQKSTSNSVAGRMLMMQLTDGTVDIKGMEYRSIPAVNINLNPGLKILVHGTVLCRCGVMMLTANNVSILGGEVEAIVEAGRQEHIISTSLGQNVPLCDNRPDLPRATFDSKQATDVRQVVLSECAPKLFGANDFRTSLVPLGAVQQRITLESSDHLDFPDDDDDIFSSSKLDAEFFNVQNNDPPTARVNTPASTFPRASMPQLSDRCTGQRAGLRSPSKPEQENTPKRVKTDIVDFDEDFDDDIALQDYLSNSGLVSAESIDRLLDTDQDRNASSSSFERSLNNASSRTLDSYNSAAVLPSSRDACVVNGRESRDKYESVCSLSSAANPHLVRPLATPKNDSFGGQIDLNVGGERRFSTRSEPRMLSDASWNLQSGLDRSMKLPSPNTSTESSMSSKQSSCPTLSKDEAASSKYTTSRANDHSNAEDAVPNSDEPFTYLSLVLNDKSASCGRVFKVKAYIATLWSRLEYNDGNCWSLTVKINDGSATLVACVSDEMLTSLIGFTAQESRMIKGQTDKNSRLRLTEGVRHCQETLTSLSAILYVSMNVDGVSTIERYRHVTLQDVELLKRRANRLT